MANPTPAEGVCRPIAERCPIPFSGVRTVPIPMTSSQVAPPAAVPEAGELSGSRVARLHLSIALGLTGVVAVAPHLIRHPNAPPRLHVWADGLLGGWLRWDGWWYVMIARHGYTYVPHHISSVAYFPLYPLAAHLISMLLPGGTALATIVVTLVSGAAALVLFHTWCRRRMSGAAARGAVVALAVYPFAWFLYGAAYSDAMFLALVLAAFLLLEDDRPVLAGLVGALATAARPTGITLVIGLVAVMVERRRSRNRSGATSSRELGVLLSIGGLAAWCAFLALRFHNPFAFIETEGSPGWDQSPGIHTWLKLGFWHKISTLATVESASILLQVIVMVAFLCLVPAVARRFGAGYAVYTAAAILAPAISTGDFLGLGRYVLAAFPVFAVVGSAVHDAPWRKAATVTSAGLLIVGTALFSSGYLIS